MTNHYEDMVKEIVRLKEKLDWMTADRDRMKMSREVSYRAGCRIIKQLREELDKGDEK